MQTGKPENTFTFSASNGRRNALTREWALELVIYNIRISAIIVAESWLPKYAIWMREFRLPKKN